jgi:hypothetical protein
MPIPKHDDRGLLAELITATRQLRERLRAAGRHGFCCSVAARAAREATRHVTLAHEALGDGAREMDGLLPGNAATGPMEIPALPGG